jgi:hypothetical protein
LHIDTAETKTTTQVDKLIVKAGTTTLATLSNLDKNTGSAQKTFDVSRQTSFVIDDTALTLS